MPGHIAVEPDARDQQAVQAHADGGDGPTGEPGEALQRVRDPERHSGERMTAHRRATEDEERGHDGDEDDEQRLERHPAGQGTTAAVDDPETDPSHGLDLSSIDDRRRRVDD